MWTPKQLLHGKTIDALYLGGFTTLQIEFFGWLSWTSAALNNSRNPVKAAHTILAKDTILKMLDTFTRRKCASIAPPATESHPLADKAFDDLEWHIKEAHEMAKLRAADYEDFTQGGVSDGNDLSDGVGDIGERELQEADNV
jgi:hypothetical protein